MARHSNGQMEGRPPRADDGRARRPRKRRDLLATLLILVGLAALGVAGYLWGSAQLRYYKQDQINRELAAFATVYDTESDAPKVDWEGLKAINDEVVGWLQIPGTTINYPVYQANDNEYYLHHSAMGEWAVGGQLFSDCDGTRPGMVDQLTLVYGHHLLDGSMFEQVAEMDQQDRFDEITTVWYVTEQATWECEPLLLYYTHSSDQDVRTFTFESDEEFRGYLGERLARAVTTRPDAAQIIGGTNHVLTLITCNYYEEFDGYGRTVLVCVPKGEAREALASRS